MKDLYDVVVQHWAPRERSKSHQQLVEVSTGHSPVPAPQDSQAPAEEPVAEDELEPRDLSPEFEDVAKSGEGPKGALGDGSQSISGECTPTTTGAVEDDEYLAWTLGGRLKKTPSPGKAWGFDEMTPLSKEIAAIEYLDVVGFIFVVCSHHVSSS